MITNKGASNGNNGNVLNNNVQEGSKKKKRERGKDESEITLLKAEVLSEICMGKVVRKEI